MKLDSHYSHIDVCPVTGDQMNDDDIYRTDGVCPRCGHADNWGNIAHHQQIVGRWNRPSLFEKLFKGKRIEFLRKEEEDTIMDALKGEHL